MITSKNLSLPKMLLSYHLIVGLDYYLIFKNLSLNSRTKKKTILISGWQILLTRKPKLVRWGFSDLEKPQKKQLPETKLKLLILEKKSACEYVMSLHL